MKVNAIKCLKCGDIIYSRATHDFHWCTCNSVAVDGGFEYFKIAGNQEDFKIMEIDVDTDKMTLFNDWNKDKNKYGTIKKGVNK